MPKYFLPCLFLFLLGYSPKSSAQKERSFRDLFVDPWTFCMEAEKKAVKTLDLWRQDQLPDSDVLAALADWAAECGPNEPVQSAQLLWYFYQNQKLPDTLQLLPYLSRYTDFLNALNQAPMVYPHLVRYSDLQKGLCQELLKNNDWPPNEELFLRTMTQNSSEGVENVLYRRRFYRDSTGQALRRKLSGDPKNIRGHFELAYLHYFFADQLGDIFDHSPGFDISFRVGNPKHQLVLSTHFGFLRSDRQLRIHRNDSTYLGKSNLLWGIGAGYSAQLWATRLGEWRLGAQFYYEMLNTDAQEINEFDELVNITVDAFSVAPSLEWSLRTHAGQRVGFRARYHLINFNRSRSVRTAMRGNYLSAGLFYRF